MSTGICKIAIIKADSTAAVSSTTGSSPEPPPAAAAGLGSKCRHGRARPGSTARDHRGRGDAIESPRDTGADIEHGGGEDRLTARDGGGEDGLTPCGGGGGGEPEADPTADAAGSTTSALMLTRHLAWPAGQSAGQLHQFSHGAQTASPQ